MSSRFLMVGMAISVCALAMGCSSKSEAPKPIHGEQLRSGPAWTLSLKSSCETGATSNSTKDQCLAKYGFSVNADGAYRVGPGPQGQVREGLLGDAELNAIRAQVQTAIAGTAPIGTENHETGVENVSDDSLTLTRPGALERVLVHNTADDLYFSTGSADDAKSLHAAIRDLANGYYRLPFGDACGDAADKITAAALGLAQCQTDSDCVYIDAYSGFDVVPPSSVQWLLSEDCTAVRPPVVANKLAILGGAQSLEDLYATARSLCGAEFSQSAFDHECAYEQKATSAQPVCVQNRCQSRL